MEIKNSKYRNWSYINRDENLIHSTNIYDIAIHSHYGSVYEHKIIGVNLKGVYVETQQGHVFIKWANIISIKK